MQRRQFISGLAAGVATWPLLGRGHPAEKLYRYPDPRVEVLDPRFGGIRVGNAAIERLHTGMRWAEGPVWFGDGRYLIWSDIPNNQMLRWSEEDGSVSVFRQPSNNTNGHCRDRQGRLISCESRRVTRTEYDGTITMLADSFEGKPFNAVNDIVVHPDGALWFTDPGYGIMGFYEGFPAEFEQPESIYRLDPASGELTRVDASMVKPNGLCFSPDFKKLYVVDTGTPKSIEVFDVRGGTTLANRQRFHQFEAGGGDGVRCDTAGNVWATAGWAGEGVDGVRVLAANGDWIGQIHLPETCSNLCFGGVKRNRLFMTASKSLYSLYVNIQGAEVL